MKKKIDVLTLWLWILILVLFFTIQKAIHNKG